MSSRKEEERNEKIIRGLMKLPPNRRCINCNSIGPQYVCTNFWTFICIACSGIHREFTHRVKSVSMAKFTSQEVEALQKGGNQRAREIYLKDWDLQRQRLPDSSNPEKIRDFIRSVYLDRKYAGGKISDKPPRDSQSPRNHEEDHRRASSYHSYSQSPPYEHQYEDRRYGKQAGMLTRKPGSDRGYYDGKISSFVYSPGRSVEKMYEDKFANEGSGSRASDYSVSSGGDTFRSGVQSPNFQKEVGYASPPVPTGRDVIAEDIRHQTLNNFPEANTKRDARVIPRPQRTSSSGSFGSSDGNSVSHKLVNSTTLADFILEAEQSTGTSQTPSGGMVYADSFNSSVINSPPTSSAAPIDLFANFTHQTSCVFHPTATLSSPPLDLFADIAQQPASVIHPSTVSSGRPIDLFSDPTTHPASSIVQSPATGSGPPAELFADITHQPSTTTQPPAFPSPPGVDLFADISQKQSSTTHVEQKPSSVPFAQSEGWATFDLPLHPTAAHEPKQQQPLPNVAPEGGISKGSLETHSYINNSVQWSSVQNPTSQGPFPLVANHWHEIAHTAQPSAGPTGFQSWNAFDDPTTGVSHHSFENLSQTFEPQVSAQKSFIYDGHCLNSKNAEDLFKDGLQKSSTDDIPGSSLLFSGVVSGSTFSQSIPSMGGMPSRDYDQKPTNPFDLPYDSELEPSIGFLNLSSLQAALADPSSSPAFLGDVSHQWFPQSPVPSYIPTVQQGGLAYMAGQTVAPQLPNLSSQGSVASLGGNPFA